MEISRSSWHYRFIDKFCHRRLDIATWRGLNSCTYLTLFGLACLTAVVMMVVAVVMIFTFVVAPLYAIAFRLGFATDAELAHVGGTVLVLYVASMILGVVAYFQSKRWSKDPREGTFRSLLKTKTEKICVPLTLKD